MKVPRGGKKESMNHICQKPRRSVHIVRFYNLFISEDMKECEQNSVRSGRGRDEKARVGGEGAGNKVHTLAGV